MEILSQFYFYDTFLVRKISKNKNTNCRLLIILFIVIAFHFDATRELNPNVRFDRKTKNYKTSARLVVLFGEFPKILHFRSQRN